MNFRYYKIGMSVNEFKRAFNLFVDDDNNFKKISTNLNIDIYRKYNRMGIIDCKRFNYVVVNINGDNVNNDTLSEIFSEHLKNINIKSRNPMNSCLYLIFIVVKTHKMNENLIDFIKNGFYFNKKGRYDCYVTIPVVFEENGKSLYVGCYPDNDLDKKWFNKEMIIWLLDNLQKKGIHFTKISLIKSTEKEKYVSNITSYENIYNRNIYLELKTKKTIYIFIILVCIYLMFRFLHEKYLNILFCILIIGNLVNFINTFYISDEEFFSKFNKISLKNINNLKLKETLNILLEKKLKGNLDAFVILDRDKALNIYEMFNEDKNYYIILLDDSYEQKILSAINKKNVMNGNRYLVLKKEDNYLKFLKDDNINMKKRFLKIISKLL